MSPALILSTPASSSSGLTDGSNSSESSSPQISAIDLSMDDSLEAIAIVGMGKCVERRAAFSCRSYAI